MKQILADVNSRSNSCATLLEHIKKLEDNYGKILESSILKSSFLLMLYNNIEATLYACFEKIHATANSLTYNDLSLPIKKICAEYHFKDNKKPFDMVEKLLSTSIKLPLLDEYGKKIQLFSGNLDERKINAISKVYGIPITRLSGTKDMVTIKQKRNKLAHGQETFSASCRGYTSRELGNMKKNCETFLQNFLSNIEYFLTKKMYQKTNI